MVTDATFIFYIPLLSGIHFTRRRPRIPSVHQKDTLEEMMHVVPPNVLRDQMDGILPLRHGCYCVCGRCTTSAALSPNHSVSCKESQLGAGDSKSSLSYNSFGELTSILAAAHGEDSDSTALTGGAEQGMESTTERLDLGTRSGAVRPIPPSTPSPSIATLPIAQIMGPHDPNYSQALQHLRLTSRGVGSAKSRAFSLPPSYRMFTIPEEPELEEQKKPSTNK